MSPNATPVSQRSQASIRAAVASGCRMSSPSTIFTNGLVTRASPARVASAGPPFGMLMTSAPGSAAARRSSRAKVSSVDPSSTRMYSASVTPDCAWMASRTTSTYPDLLKNVARKLTEDI